MRILVIDDEPVIRLTIAAALDEFEIIEADDGVAALDLLASQAVDLVVLDVKMPGVSGLDVLEHLRIHPETADIPVVIVTARGREADHVRGFEAGADAYLTKPFTFEDLVETVRLVSSLSPGQRLEHRARELERARSLLSIESLLG